MYATGAQANNNPVVFFDIAADNEPLGRVTFEVSELQYDSYYGEGVMNINDVRSVPLYDWLS